VFDKGAENDGPTVKVAGTVVFLTIEVKKKVWRYDTANDVEQRFVN
jgi:hypothetical protein